MEAFAYHERRVLRIGALYHEVSGWQDDHRNLYTASEDGVHYRQYFDRTILFQYSAKILICIHSPLYPHYKADSTPLHYLLQAKQATNTIIRPFPTHYPLMALP